jgi:hypothetical protein
MLVVVVEALLEGFAAEHAATRNARLTRTAARTTFLRLIREKGLGATRSAARHMVGERIGDPMISSTRISGYTVGSSQDSNAAWPVVIDG